MKYLILVLLALAGCGKELPKTEITHPEATPTPTATPEPVKDTNETKKESEPNRLTPTPVVNQPEPISEETPSESSVSIVTLSYAYLQSSEVCAALSAWNPDANNIVFVSSYSGLKHYVFSKEEIYLSNINGSSKQVLAAPLLIASGPSGAHLIYCCIDLVVGQLPRVRPLCAN